MASLKAIEQLIVCKTFNEEATKAIRARVHRTGVIHIDFTARFHGSVKIAEDPSNGVSPTCRALSIDTFAKMLYSAGCQRDAAMKALFAAFDDTDEPTGEKALYIAGIRADIKRRFDALPKEPRRGNVTAQITVEAVRQPGTCSEFDDAPASVSEVFEGRVVDSVKEAVEQ